MNAAGIDVSSRKSTVAVLRPFGEVVKLPFDVRHNAEDLEALAEQLKSIEGETRVVMEHTGRYYESSVGISFEERENHSILYNKTSSKTVIVFSRFGAIPLLFP